MFPGKLEWDLTIESGSSQPVEYVVTVLALDQAKPSQVKPMFSCVRAFSTAALFCCAQSRRGGKGLSTVDDRTRWLRVKGKDRGRLKSLRHTRALTLVPCFCFPPHRYLLTSHFPRSRVCHQLLSTDRMGMFSTYLLIETPQDPTHNVTVRVAMQVFSPCGCQQLVHPCLEIPIFVLLCRWWLMPRPASCLPKPTRFTL